MNEAERRAEYWANKGKRQNPVWIMERCSVCKSTVGTFKKGPNGHYLHVNCPGPRRAA